MTGADAELIDRIAARDEAAFAAFYDRHAPRVHALVVKLLGAGRDAEDVLQEVFWQVWSQAERFDLARGAAAAWLAAMARSRALDHLRRKSRQGAELRDTEIRAPDEGVTCAVSRSEDADRTRLALDNLPDEQKSAIRMAFYDGFTYEEIARRQQLPLGTVKTRIRLGMRKLREALIETEVVAT